MQIPQRTPRFQGTVIAYVPDKAVELKAVLITDMARYTKDVHSFSDRVEFRFQTGCDDKLSCFQVLKTRLKQKLAFNRLGDWHNKYGVRYGFDSSPTPEK